MALYLRSGERSGSGGVSGARREPSYGLMPRLEGVEPLPGSARAAKGQRALRSLRRGLIRRVCRNESGAAFRNGARRCGVRREAVRRAGEAVLPSRLRGGNASEYSGGASAVRRIFETPFERWRARFGESGFSGRAWSAFLFMTHRENRERKQTARRRYRWARRREDGRWARWTGGIPRRCLSTLRA